jgi:hypothetical protein
MVHLRTVPNAFHARVIAARLGADGIVTQLRGAVDGVYPIGDVMVYVREDDFDDAQELLLADEVESVFESDEAEADRDHRTMGWTGWMVAAMLVALWASLTVRVI